MAQVETRPAHRPRRGFELPALCALIVVAAVLGFPDHLVLAGLEGRFDHAAHDGGVIHDQDCLAHCCSPFLRVPISVNLIFAIDIGLITGPPAFHGRPG